MSKDSSSEKTQSEAIILKAVAGSFLLEDCQSGQRDLAYARGILRQRRHAPIPGDRVEYSPSGDPDYPLVLEKVFKRKNSLLRPAVANLDYLLITVSRTNPKADYLLIDKLLLLAAKNKIKPVLVLTKGDEDQGEGLAEILYNYSSAALPIYLSESGFGQDPDFFKSFKNSILAFAGQSGVGKSTFLNRQFGQELMKQGDLSEKIQRGKQTTRHTELFRYADLYLADTPGFQNLEISQMDLDLESFQLAWPEIQAYAEHCRFNDCRHLGEKGCAVSEHVVDEEKVESVKEKLLLEVQGKKRLGFLKGLDDLSIASWISSSRYERYQQLFNEYLDELRRF